MRKSRAQALGGLILLGAGVGLAALAVNRRKAQTPRRVYDYSDRSGFPRPAAEMRGAWTDKKQQAKKERAASPLSPAARISP